VMGKGAPERGRGGKRVRGGEGREKGSEGKGEEVEEMERAGRVFPSPHMICLCDAPDDRCVKWQPKLNAVCARRCHF